MTSRVLCLLAAAASAFQASAGTLPEQWQRVQVALASANASAIEESVQDLRESANEVAAWRLTPYAEALCAWAEAHGGDTGRTTVRLAATLDPSLPGPIFLEARWQWRDGEYVRATWSHLRGCFRLVAESTSRRLTVVAMVGWLLLAVGGGLSTTVAVQTVRCLREAAHDSWELGRSLFRGLNAVVFAAVVLLLPLFAGLGPVWVLGWLFAIGWVYLNRLNRVAAVTACVLLAMLSGAFDLWQAIGLRGEDLETRTRRMVAERQVDLSTLREVIGLGEELEDRATYHLVVGELLRLHADLVGAKLEFQKAVVQAPSDPRAHLLLGGMALEDGDIARASQSYNRALELDPRSVIAYRNLSYAYDQSYRFQAADSARNKAEELVRQGIEVASIPGRVPRVSFPRLGDREVDALFSGLPPGVATAGGRPLGAAAAALVHPLALCFWVTGLIGLGVLALRRRYGWASTACIRCGRLFCRRCKSAIESESYCSQCISVFLKRDVVSIEQQSAKLAQIRRWELNLAAGRRLVTIFLPGAGPVLRGDLWWGFVATSTTWFLAVGVVVMVPAFFTAIEPHAAWLPLEVLLSLGFVAMWVHSVTNNWRRR